MPERERLRLFIACELPAEVHAALADLQRDLRGAGAEGLRWVRPEGIHVTLKFLGETDAARLPAIRSALATAVPDPLSIALQLSGVGSFGGRGSLRVVWVGLTGDLPPLSLLARTVDGAMAALGFDRERRPFAPHLTLARVREEVLPPARARLADLLAAYRPPPLPAFTADHVSLVQSRIGPGGAVYTALATFPPRQHAPGESGG